MDLARAPYTPAERTPRYAPRRCSTYFLNSSLATVYARCGPRSPTQTDSVEPKIDGVRGLIVFRPDGVVETRNRSGQVRDWQRHRPSAAGLRRLAQRLPILWDGTVLDAEPIAGRFAGTMAALQGSARHGDALRVHVFDPMLASVDLRRLQWEERRERLELLAQAFELPYELVPLVEPAPSLAEDMAAGAIEGIVLKDRRSTYRDGSGAGWSKVKDPSWYARESWRFQR